ncbi:MAG: GNAT family N-acetyltransferase [Tabrizicola sp.]|nr:GNAT family N-acetyltransferase [Tabrizicola sp.]
MFDAQDPDEGFLPLQQSAAYGAALRACGATVFCADLGIGEGLVVERPGLRLLSRGPLWQGGHSPAERRRTLRRLARWPGLTIVTPEEDLAGFGLIPLVTPVHQAIWDLSTDLRAGLTGKWRNRLSVAERQGIVIRRGSAQTLDHLIAAEAAQRREKGYRALPAAFARGLPREALSLWEWRHAGQVGAAMCFVRHGASASYHLGWAGRDARERSVHNLMLWHAATRFRSEGIGWLDLGSVNTEDAPGLARFKLGTGAALRRLGATALVLPA